MGIKRDRRCLSRDRRCLSRNNEVNRRQRRCMKRRFKGRTAEVRYVTDQIKSTARNEKRRRTYAGCDEWYLNLIAGWSTGLMQLSGQHGRNGWSFSIRTRENSSLISTILRPPPPPPPRKNRSQMPETIFCLHEQTINPIFQCSPSALTEEYGRCALSRELVDVYNGTT